MAGPAAPRHNAHSQRLMRLLPKFLVVATAISLAACDSIPLMEKDIVLQCPDYFVLEDAASLTKFRDGPGRDITDVEVRAQIGEMSLGCLSNIDNDTNSGKMVIEIAPVVAAEMGPANKTQTATLPYFVVVTDPNKNILYREPLTMEISFKGNKTQIVILPPPTKVELPITPNIRNDYYRIYSGFELTKDQVEFNRKAIKDRLQ
jgi:hypothetical protein